LKYTHLDYAQPADERKCRQLKARGYRVVTVKAKTTDAGLDALAALLEQ